MLYFFILLIAFSLFGFWGGLIASFLLTSLYRQVSFGSGAINPLGNAQRQATFFDTIFVCSGYLAKADNQVSQSEIDLMEQFMRQIRLDQQARNRAISLFKQGVAGSIDLDEQLRLFDASCGRTKNLRQALLQYLVTISFADGELHRNELKLLKYISNKLHLTDYELQSFINMAKSQFSKGDTTTTSLEEAYKVLGANSNESMKDITKKYRRLMSKNHPDKLMGQGLPKEMIDLATKKSQQIQDAYQTIKKHHK